MRVLLARYVPRDRGCLGRSGGGPRRHAGAAVAIAVAALAAVGRGGRAGAAVAIAVAALAVGAVGCSQPGTQAPAAQAAKIDVATSRMSLACGYAEELTAFGGPHARGLAAIEALAASAAHKLASVYAQDQTDIYQGESVGAVVNDSISLLDGCGLGSADKALRQAVG